MLQELITLQTWKKIIVECLCRIVTGSFDKTVKIWSPDGKLVHRLDNFLATVTGICYVPKNKTIWAAGGTSYAYLYDPKSGDNVSTSIWHLNCTVVHY